MMKNTDIIAALIDKDIELEQSGTDLTDDNSNVRVFLSVLEVAATKKVGKLTMAVSVATAQNIAKHSVTGTGKRQYCMLFIVDADEYDALKTR